MNTRFRTRILLAAAAAPLALGALPAAAQDMMNPAMGAMGAMGGMGAMAPMAAHETRVVALTIENLTTGQNFSPAFFTTHAAGDTLFKLGEPASEALWNVAEGGNIGPFSGAAAGTLGATYGDAILAIHTPIGTRQTVYIEVDAAHPLISGVFMLGMTNDGFSGISGADAWSLAAPVTLDAFAFDAGSEKNSELKGYLGALGGGNMRDPENGVVTRHTGIRGDADAPAAWKFDPALPVARVTITPLGIAGAM